MNLYRYAMDAGCPGAANQPCCEGEAKNVVDSFPSDFPNLAC
jgi:hypothetical protein